MSPGVRFVCAYGLGVVTCLLAVVVAVALGASPETSGRCAGAAWLVGFACLWVPDLVRS